MEGLIILLAEVLVAAAIAAGAVLWSMAGAVAALCVGVVWQRHLAKFAAWFGGIAAAIAAVLIAAVFVLNTLFFEPAVRFVADYVGERTGAVIRYDTVEGSLLEGCLAITKFEAVRSGHPERDFSFAVEQADMELNPWSLLPFVTPTFDAVHLKNVSGRLAEHRKPDSSEGGKNSGGGSPDFAVNDLRISNLSVTVEKPDGRTLTFDMPLVEARPLRSQQALFDVMFRSTVEGSVNGHPVRIITRAIPEGRTTEWDIERMPVSVLAAFAGQAPFTWFETGVADVQVRDEWQAGSVADIDMDWRFLFEDVRISAPDEAGLKERALVLATKKYFEARDGRVDFSFELVLNREEFRASASDDARWVFNAVVDALFQAIADETGVDREKLKKDFFGAARDYLDKRRKGKDQ